MAGSCPAGYVSLWSRMRSLMGQYMPPVEEACAGLFPPMVQKILVINVPRIFGPACAPMSEGWYRREGNGRRATEGGRVT